MSALHVTGDNFEKEVLQSDKPVLVDFWAVWCGPCQMVGPILEEISEKHTDIKVCKVNVDEQQDLAMKYEVTAIPAFYCFKGGKIISQKVGVQSMEELIKMTEE